MRSTEAVFRCLRVIEVAKLMEQRGRPKGYHFIAVMDDRTCEICAKHHCKVYKVGQFMPDPPLHDNCRCYLEPVWELKPIPGFEAIVVTVKPILA